LLSNAKKFHRSLYFYSDDFNVNNIDTSSSNIFAKKKDIQDIESDFLNFSKLISSMIYFDDLYEESSSFIGDLSFYLPIFSSLLIKDFYNFKSLRSSSFDLSFFFSKHKFEEIILF